MGWVSSRSGHSWSAGAALGWGFDLGLSCQALAAALAGCQLLDNQNCACPPTAAGPVSSRHLVVLPADKNTSPAAAHLVLETSLGNSNKKLKIKG